MRYVFALAMAATLMGWNGVCLAQVPLVKIILENASVRVELATFEPGSGTGLHSIVTPESGVVLEGEMTLTSPYGQQRFRAGEAFWIPGLTPHDLRNSGQVPAKVWGIFLKRCD